MTEGHKYIAKGCPSGGGYTTYSIADVWNGVFSDIGNGSIFTYTGNAVYMAIRFFEYYSPNNLIFWPQLIDLTATYGAGNEPTTVAQFVQDYPDVYYPYNPET